MRIVGIILLSFTSVLLSTQAVISVHVQSKRYYTCYLFWSDFCNLLEYTREPARDLFLRLSQNPQYSLLDFLQLTCVGLRRGEDFYTAYGNAIENSAVNWGEMKNILAEMGKIPGSSNLEAQLEKLTYYCQRLNSISENAQMSKKERTKLYNSLGLAGGAFIFIMLI